MPLLSCWILEDEPPALRRLVKLLQQVAPQLKIAHTFDAIAPARAALKEAPHPDIIFSDIHLADGLCFDLWESVACDCPIIFTTAYDEYGIRAFKVNSIDYLLKPIGVEELQRALDKVERLQRQGTPNWESISQLFRGDQPSYRERFLAQYRQDWVPVRTADLRQIFSADSLTFAVDAGGKRYMLDESLDRLTEELDPRYWFRINRAQLVHVDAVRKVSSYFNHRLVLDLHPAGEGNNIVSRQRVKECREWLER